MAADWGCDSNIFLNSMEAYLTIIKEVLSIKDIQFGLQCDWIKESLVLNTVIANRPKSYQIGAK